MPPWTTLARLPWATILTQTASLLKQAKDLRDSRTAPPVAPPPSDDVEALRLRLAELEQQQRADAEIIQQLAREIAAIAAAAEMTAARARQAYIIAGVGIALGMAALLVGWLR